MYVWIPGLYGTATADGTKTRHSLSFLTLVHTTPPSKHNTFPACVSLRVSLVLHAGVPRSRFEAPLPGAVPWGTYRPRPPSVSSLPPPPLPGGMKLNQEQKIQVMANQFSQTTAMLRKGARGSGERERERGNLSREGSQSLQQMVAQAISGDEGNGCETPQSATSQARSPR